MKVLFLSEIKWRYLRTRKQQLARHFPKKWKILFVEPFAIGRSNRFYTQVDQNVRYVTIPVVKNFPQPWIRWILAFSIVQGAIGLTSMFWLWIVLCTNKFRSPDVVIVSNIYYAPIIRLLFGRRFVIYDCNDNHLAFPGTPSWAHRYSHSLHERADRIVCSSQALLDTIPREHHHKIELIGNGVDVTLFSGRTVEVPDMIKKLARPILLYLGAISEWVDLGLLQHIAENHHDKTLMLIGPVAPPVRSHVEQLLELDNVHYLGEVEHDTISTYITAADVCLIPFLKNDLTRTVNPNKLYEYLAAGKPVVSIDISPDVTALRNEVFVATNHDEFIQQINAALSVSKSHIEARKQIALRNTWQKKTDLYVALILRDLYSKNRKRTEDQAGFSENCRRS